MPGTACKAESNGIMSIQRLGEAISIGNALLSTSITDRTSLLETENPECIIT